MSIQHNLEKIPFDYYDINGYILAVSGPVKGAFHEEFSHFKCSKKKAMLYIIETSEKDLPLKQRGSDEGVDLPFGGGNVVKYEKGISSGWVVFLIMHFITWKDKTFLHCGAVAKDGKALIFPATGDVGKTKTTMYLVSKGYEYLSDEWLVIGDNGVAYPFLRKTKVFDYNLKSDRTLAKRILGPKRFFYDLIYKTLKLIPKIFHHRYIQFACGRITPFFQRRVDEIFPNAKYAKPSKIEKVFWLVKDESAKEIRLENTTPKEIAERMYYAIFLEKFMFYFNYLLYAYPSGPNKEWDNYFLENKRIMQKAFQKAKVIKKVIVPDEFDVKEMEKVVSSV